MMGLRKFLKSATKSFIKHDPIARTVGSTNKAMRNIAAGQKPLSAVKDVIKSDISTARGQMSSAIDKYQQGAKKFIRNTNAISTALPKLLGVSPSFYNSRYVNPMNDALALESLTSGDARLLNKTENLNSGVFNKQDRIDATKKDAAGLNLVRQIGSAAASSGIPIVNLIGLGANAIANQRLHEADLQTGRQAIGNFGGAALGAAGSGAGALGKLSVGVGQGALSAYANNQDVGKGALFGGLSAGAGLAGGAVGGGITGGVAQGAMQGALTGYQQGLRNSELLEAAAKGGVYGGIGAGINQYGQSQGWDPVLTGGIRGGVIGGLKDGSEGIMYGAGRGAIGSYGDYAGIPRAIGNVALNEYQARQASPQMVRPMPRPIGATPGVRPVAVPQPGALSTYAQQTQPQTTVATQTQPQTTVAPQYGARPMNWVI